MTAITTRSVFDKRSTVSLRDRLREATRDPHQRVDDAFSTLDLGNQNDMAVFLAAQSCALGAIAPLPGPDCAKARALLDEMTAALDADLNALALVGPAPAQLPGVQVDATAVLYITLGSRRGAQVLAKRWRDATGRGRAQAGRYLTLDPRNADWRALCDRLAVMPAHDAQARRTIDDTDAIFALFGRALDMVRGADACAGRAHAASARNREHRPITAEADHA